MKESQQTNRWAILIYGMICMLIMGVCYTYSLFQPYVMKHFNVDSPNASLPFTIFIAVFCIGNFVGGRMQQKTNVKLTLIVGYVLMVLGWSLTAMLPENMFWAMFITFGGLFGIGDGIVYNVIVSLMPKRFLDRKCFPSGLTLAMQWLSSTLLIPLVSSWLSSYGFSWSFLAVAGVYAAVGVFGTITMKNPPKGYMEDYKGTGAIIATKKQYEVDEVFKVKEFWTLMGLYFCAVPAYLLLSAIFVSYGTDKGLTLTMATFGVSAASMCQVGGRFIIPTVSDMIGRKAAFAISFLITATGVALLTVSTGYLYVLCFCLLSFSYGGSQACFAPIAADRFGTKNIGTILSLTMIGFGLGSIGASIVAKMLGTTTAFVCAGAVSLAGIALVLTLPSPKQSSKIAVEKTA